MAIDTVKLYGDETETNRRQFAVSTFALFKKCNRNLLLACCY
ncbi:hypothetical protein COLO4_21968 [Corchorus olitorius]|uniref:Uncharacterized protein n=1 Tax=Corchorus olitorius TaxID=93759 RepID=A0A1R3IPS2_9ROSI|nr:hypothetical protein COLO4_21968 [Corchorus olitorius]